MRRGGVAAAALAIAANCAGPVSAPGPAPTAAAQPRPAPVAAATFEAADLVVEGALEQGGWLRGTLPAGAQAVTLGDVPVTVAPDGRFFAGIDRDAPPALRLSATGANGARATRELAIARRDWQIERVNVPLRGSVPAESFMRRRQPELDAIAAARALRSDSAGWRQRFQWPVRGRISGRFGAQRIYQGVPGAYHSGLDIAPGAGTPYVAPADGVVVLAATRPFSLEGNLLIIDHGMGLNSAFLHSATLAVRQGDRVRQGQLLGTVGATGRATGPHLHWSLKWQDARLDPLLFVPAQ